MWPRQRYVSHFHLSSEADKRSFYQHQGWLQPLVRGYLPPCSVLHGQASQSRLEQAVRHGDRKTMENGDLEQSFSRLKQEIYSRVLRSIFMDGCQFMCIDRRPKRTFERGLEIIWETFCTRMCPGLQAHKEMGLCWRYLKIFGNFWNPIYIWPPQLLLPEDP